MKKLNSLEQLKKEKKDLEIKIKELEEKREVMKAILEGTGEAIYAVDLEKKIITFNPSAEELTGFKREELIGKYCYDFLKFIDGEEKIDICKENCPVEKVFKTGKIAQLPKETCFLAKDGRKIVVADSAAPIKTSDGKIIGGVVIFRDVTKEREIDKMKTQFVSITSHQLRTPLSSVRWFSEMLLEGDVGRLKDLQKGYVREIYDSTLQMIALVNDLLNVSRLETGKIKIEPKLVKLEKIIKDLLRDFEPIARARNVKISFKVPEKLPKIFVDPLKIGQAIQNLISNAINYNKPKGKVEVSLKKTGDQILFSCKDTGMGIPKDEQWKVFSRFFRGSNVIKKEREGTGLGLFIAKSIIEGSRGKIWFESEEWVGSTFYFNLPSSRAS